MLGTLFFECCHRYTPSSSACCIMLPGCCRGECPSLPPPTASRCCCTSWVRCQRRCCCAIAWLIKSRVRSRMAGLHCCSSLASFSSHITTRLHWRLASVRSSIACPYQRAALAVVLAGPGVMAQGAGFPGKGNESGAGGGQGQRACGGLAAE